MTGPPAAKPASTNLGVSPTSSPEVRAIEIRDSNGELVRKASPEQAAAIVAQGHGGWAKASNGRGYVRLKSISAGDRCSGSEWLRPAAVVRQRLRRNEPGRESIPMFRFVAELNKS
jgi:hypothetical protein